MDASRTLVFSAAVLVLALVATWGINAAAFGAGLEIVAPGEHNGARCTAVVLTPGEPPPPQDCAFTLTATFASALAFALVAGLAAIVAGRRDDVRWQRGALVVAGIALVLVVLEARRPDYVLGPGRTTWALVATGGATLLLALSLVLRGREAALVPAPESAA